MNRLESNVRQTPRPSKRFATSWQMLVIPRPPSNAPGEGKLTPFRIDGPQAISEVRPAPHYPLNWTQSIGIHTGRDNVCTAADHAASLSPSSTSAGHDAVPKQLSELLAEAAHDIRSPLATAQQILRYVGGRARSGLPLDAEEFEMLKTAHARLVEADQWAEEILAERYLQRNSVGIRRRFYPHQWRSTVEPLLQDMARQHSVRLDWSGWDHSLPRLYLDSNRLTRIVMNLVANAMEASSIASNVSIRVAWQRNITPCMTLTIEDSGIGLDQDLMREINSTSPSEANATSGLSRAGLGLKTSQALIASIGGTLAVQNGASGGTHFRLTLPVDNPPSLIQSWLRRNADLLRAGTLTSLSMHLIVASRMDSALADQQLQLSALPSDFIYRIAGDRWLWLTLNSSDMQQNAIPARLESVVARLLRAGRQMRSQANCQVECVWNHSLASLAGPEFATQSTRMLRGLADVVSQQIDVQQSGRVPPVDELGVELDSALKPLNSSQATRARYDCAEPTLKRHARPALNAPALDSPAMNLETLASPAATAIADVAKQWKIIQSKLRKLHGHKHE